MSEALDLLSSTDHESLFLKGKCYDRLHKWTKAISSYEEALSLCTKNSQKAHVYFRMGFCRLRSKKEPELGLSEIEKANKLAPRTPEIMLKLASIYCSQEEKTNLTKALDLVDSVIQVGGDKLMEAALLKA